MKHVYTLRVEDIGKGYIEIVTCPYCHQHERLDVSEFLGRVFPLDVGKRVYLSGHGVPFVENDEQYRTRIAG